MSTPIQPDKYARAAGFDPYDFVEAVQAGEDEYSGVPIGSWRQQDPNGGTYLAVPDDHAEQIGLSPTNGRSNPSQAMQQVESAIAGGSGNANWPEAVKDAAPPVSANAGGALAAAKFADTVKEQPQIMGDVADVAALLGGAGLAYATSSEDDSYAPLKAGAVTVGVFAAFKMIRHACEQGDRQTDMAERQQRHQIQQQRQQQMGSPSERRLNGRRKRYPNDSGVRVGGA